MESEVYQLILGDRVSFANLQAVYLKDTQNMPDVPQKIIGLILLSMKHLWQLQHLLKPIYR